MKVTVAEVIAAAEKNGLKHARGTWYDYDNNETLSGCIMGQAFYNLGGHASEEYASDLVGALDDAVPVQKNIHVWNHTKTFRGLGTIMTVLNDNKTQGGNSGRYRSYKELVTALKTLAKGHEDVEIEVNV